MLTSRSRAGKLPPMTDVTSGAAAIRLRRSPLHERHAALGAKFAPFGGWEMPLEYAGGGVLKEHAAVRAGVGVFDVSHLGKARVAGPGAADFVNACLTNDLGRIAPGGAQYTLCCDDATGGVVDDIIAYLYASDHVFLIPNAANTAEVVRRLRAAAPEHVVVTDEHEAYAVLAVQGPRSAELLDALGLPTDHGYMSFRPATLAGADLTVCRTGYTGELGYELVVPAEHAVAVWDALFAAGEGFELRACGLGARDTLRTEMGYPLHGQDLSPDITPVQARAGWAVGWGKPAFWAATRCSPRRRPAPGVRCAAWRPSTGRSRAPA
ncbi:aminomethyltransferase [Micromonospora olivasterospora]|uniref:Aminomethyltransferase n=1 Tax=Micromonospora olivasterospora TaxID=1880 RepID=A0A562I4V2_MICOL|nr:aminomethyltransferase [Micromonospora olivasterospora]